MHILEKNRFRKNNHAWSDHVISVDQTKVPKEVVRNNLTDEEYRIICEGPFLVSEDDGVIIINEHFPSWGLLKDLFVILDNMPIRYLKCILHVFEAEYAREELGKLKWKNNEELLEKMLYCLIPEILKVKKE